MQILNRQTQRNPNNLQALKRRLLSTHALNPNSMRMDLLKYNMDESGDLVYHCFDYGWDVGAWSQRISELTKNEQEVILNIKALGYKRKCGFWLRRSWHRWFFDGIPPLDLPIWDEVIATELSKEHYDQWDKMGLVNMRQ